MNSARVVMAALVIAGSAGLAGASAEPIDPARPSVGPTSGSGSPAPRATNVPTLPVAPPMPEPATPAPTAPPPTALEPTLGQLIGQKLVVAMAGITPSGDLVGRIRRGEVGGVILFGSNIGTKAQLIELTRVLRDAATEGGQPRLLIAVDQEGGSIKIIPWAPPTLSAPRMGAAGDPAAAHDQGAETGTALAALGINVDLAPVADVPGSRDSFMYQQGRTISFSAETTALLSDAFASGLESANVIPSMKHFPGIGLAIRNTDASVVTIDASVDALALGLLPFRRAIANHIPLIMLSNATYSAYDSSNAAGWSSAVATTLLREGLGFTGATITDSLDGTANARGLPVTTLALASLHTGTDMILTTGSESSTRAVYDALLGEAQNGSIPLANLRASYARILALKVGH